MRNILVALVALVACDSPSTSSSVPNTCGEAWVAFCDAMFDCIPGPQSTFSYGNFQPFGRDDCIALVLDRATPIGDTSSGVIGCDDPDELGYAACYAAASRIGCDAEGRGADYGQTIAAVEACQR